MPASLHVFLAFRNSGNNLRSSPSKVSCAGTHERIEPLRRNGKAVLAPLGAEKIPQRDEIHPWQVSAKLVSLAHKGAGADRGKRGSNRIRAPVSSMLTSYCPVAACNLQPSSKVDRALSAASWTSQRVEGHKGATVQH